jgi:hypothetical protein
MKIHKNDAHDRLKHFTKQSFDIGECCQNLIDQRPFGEHPFYIFAHTRTDDDGVTKRLIWQPRLTRPKSQSNSMLFKAYPGTDTIKIIWMIPQEELWGQYGKGKLTENDLVSNSIQDFRYDRQKLDRKEQDDLSDEAIDQIYKDLSIAAREKKVKAQSNKVNKIIRI